MPLDRRASDPEKLAEEIKKSIELLLHFEERPDIFTKIDNYLENRKETDYDTCFTYYLTDKENKKSARDGVNDLKNTLPTTLITQYKKIKQIIVVDETNKTKTIYISEVGEEKKNYITESSFSIIKNDDDDIKEGEEKLHFITYLKVNDEKEKL